jgi:hypothetical protein
MNTDDRGQRSCIRRSKISVFSTCQKYISFWASLLMLSGCCHARNCF